MLEMLETINNDYSAVFSLIVSVCTMIVTVIYVIFTYMQVKENRKSIDYLEKQLKLNNQPCIVPITINTTGTEVFNDHGRRQLHIELKIKNSGNAPALSTYVFGSFKLKKCETDEKDIVEIDYLPDYVRSISIDETKNVSIRFETEEINLLIGDLNKPISKEKYINYIHKVMNRADLIIDIYYKNITNQWFHSVLRNGVLCIMAENQNKTRETYDVKIPPNKLEDDMRFQLCLTPEGFSTFDVEPIVSEDILEKLNQYDQYLHYKIK